MNRFFMLLTLGSAILSGSTLTLHFEQFGDGEQLTNQIGGVSFTNSVVLEAGLSLNEFDFPPRSGTRVIVDDGGPIMMEFGAAINSFTGFFTYLQRLSIVAVDVNGNTLATVQSLYTANTLSGGELNSTPLEQVTLAYGPGFRRVMLTGDSLGSSFVADDIEVRYLAMTDPDPIPEPRTAALVAGSLIGAAIWRRKRVAKELSRLACGVAVFGMVLSAQQPTPEVSNPYIARSETTNVRISVDLSGVGSTLIPSSVQALRVQGTTLSILGALVDDGTNGDLVANDSVFSRNFPLNPGNEPSITVTANYATRGSIRRTVVGQVSILTFAPVGAPVEQPMSTAGGTVTVGEDAVVQVPAGTFAAPTYVSVRVIDQRVFEEGASKPPDKATVITSLKPIRIEAGLKPSSLLAVKLHSATNIELAPTEELFAEVVKRNIGESEFMSISRERAFRCGAKQNICINLEAAAFFKVNPYVAYLRIVKVTVANSIFRNVVISESPLSISSVSRGVIFSYASELFNPFLSTPLDTIIETDPFGKERCKKPDGTKRSTPPSCGADEELVHHRGIDLRTIDFVTMESAKVVRAAAGGNSELRCAGGGGYAVALAVNESVLTKHMHLLRDGRAVDGPKAVGAVLGTTGNSNKCDGTGFTPFSGVNGVLRPHLHYEVWIEGKESDPLPFLNNTVSDLGPLNWYVILEGETGTGSVRKVLDQQEIQLPNFSGPIPLRMSYTLSDDDVNKNCRPFFDCYLSFILKSPPKQSGWLPRLDVKIAKWKIEQATLSVLTVGTGSGRVTSNPAGIDCQTACGAVFRLNEEVVLIASPSADSVFAGWSQACTGGDLQTIVKMTAEKQCVATFNRKAQAALSFDTSPGGNFSVQVFDATTNERKLNTFVPSFSSNFSVPLGSLPAGLYNLIIVFSGEGTRGSFTMRLSDGVAFEPPGDTSRNQILSNGSIGFPRQVVWPIRIF